MPFLYCLCALGVLVFSASPQLYSPYWVLFPLFILAIHFIWLKTWCWLLCASVFMLGLAWGNFTGHQLLAQQLDESLSGQDLIVTGRLVGLPQADAKRVRFNLAPSAVSYTSGQSLELGRFPHSIQLSWYRQPFGTYRLPPSSPYIQANTLPGDDEFVPGTEWRLRVRLKRPRGFVNPAGFDYQAWLIRQGIGATGYVLTHKDNHQLTAKRGKWTIDTWRYQLQQWLLRTSQSPERGILAALLIGDSSHVTKAQWQRMQLTGTSHLIAISGLHVGFLALFGFYVGMLLGRLLQLCWHRCPAMLIAYCCAISCAFVYAALAGFNIPTLRTFIMLALFYWVAFWRRSSRIIDIYALALAVVMLLDPLAAYDMGFWLSFGAVGLLLFYFAGRYSPKLSAALGYCYTLKNLFWGFCRSQWVMFIGLLVPLSLLINSVSLTAPLANFIAIPLVTFWVVPCLLVAAAVQSIWPSLSELLLLGAGTGMEWLQVFLDFILAMARGRLNPVLSFSPSVIALLGFSCLWLLLPKGLLPRGLGWLGVLLAVLVTVVASPLNAPQLKITLLDVGQGMAIVVQTPGKTLVYDTGPRFTEDFNAGAALVAPYLYSESITHVDSLVISHMDMDHAGGTQGLLEKVSVGEILLGEPPRDYDKYMHALDTKSCHEQASWHWGEVEFAFLHWPQTERTKTNNRSCVLLIRYRDENILLPGDIEQEVEGQLLRAVNPPDGSSFPQRPLLPQRLSLLVAAHHGSRTSSSASFLAYTRPRQVVFSSGYKNQHGHPHPQVQQRYHAIGAQVFNTATQGAIQFRWYAKGGVEYEVYRSSHRRYWFAQD